MSILDKVAAAVMPAATDEQRSEARSNFEAIAGQTGWARQILEHHQAIEAAFDEAKAARPEERMAACRRLGELLTGHSMAEEAVVYPAMVVSDAKGHATMAYEEQAMAKVQMAKLEMLDPASQQWDETFDHLKAAVEQHVYQEESEWYPELARDLDTSEADRIAQRYGEEFTRYRSDGSAQSSSILEQPARSPSMQI